MRVRGRQRRPGRLLEDVVGRLDGVEEALAIDLDLEGRVDDGALGRRRDRQPERPALVALERRERFMRLYQVHSATFDSGILDSSETHAALAELKRDKGWALGLSVSSPAQGDVVAAALKIEVNGERLFDAVQATYNVFEQAPGSSLTAAHEQGIAIIVKEAMANGRVLADASLLRYAAELDCAPDALALACVLAQPFEPHVLSGAVTADQVTANLGALAVADRLRADPELLERIMGETRQDSEAYWAERAALAWN